MADNMFELYVKIIQIFIIVLILTYFLYRKYVNKISGFVWFIVIMASALTQSIIEIILFFLFRADILNNTIHADLKEIHIIPYALALFVFFLFCELSMHSRPKTNLLIMVSILFGAYLTSYFVILSFNLINPGGIQPAVPAKYRLYRTIFNIFQFVVLGEGLYIFIKNAIIIENRKLKRISRIIAIALSVAFLFSFAKIFEYWTPWEIYGAIPFGIFFGIMAVQFLLNPYYVYLLPDKIHKIVVTSKNGDLLYSVRVGDAHKSDITNDVLFTGTISALKQVLKEVTGSKSALEHIAYKDKNMLIIENEEQNVDVVIVSDSDSFILVEAARHFTREFCTKYKRYLEQYDGTVSIFDGTTEIVRRVFPFVPPQEIRDDIEDS